MYTLRPNILPYFWDFIVDAAQQQRDQFGKIRVPVPHMK